MFPGRDHRQFVSMRHFLQDLEVRSDFTSARSDSGVRKASKKERLKSMLRMEETRDKKDRYSSLVSDNGLRMITKCWSHHFQQFLPIDSGAGKKLVRQSSSEKVLNPQPRAKTCCRTKKSK